MAKRNVTVIPATVRRFSAEPLTAVRKRRVAGYARVSTDSDEQATSYAAQMLYYKEYIQGREDWEFVGMYSDEGISATNTKHRDGFKKMVKDALDGNIDLIITKSVSRFARNTVDSLTTVRKLKEKGIEIYFEKENIWTLDAKGELLITIMSSLAQEESRSISENTTWGQRRRFAEGKASVPYKSFLGYDKGFKINEKEAETVRLIYKLYLEGYSANTMCNILEEEGRITAKGKTKWWPDVIMNILKNEKYKGDALLQKEYTVDFLTKKTKVNEGEVPQYYVEGHHEPIIEPAVYNLVQAEILRRKNAGYKYSGVSFFSSKIMCGDCGGWYGSKVWHSNSKHRKIMFRCNNKYKGCKCTTPNLTEEEIKDIFVKAFNKYFTEKEELLTNLDIIIDVLSNTDSLEKKAKELTDEISILAERSNRLINENARTVQDQNDYQERYTKLVEQYETKQAEYDSIQNEIVMKTAKREILKKHKACIEMTDEPITEFDGALWAGTVDYIRVDSNEHIVVIFKDGSGVEI